ncbi:MAG: hypothetical protein Q8N91_04390 [Candidatus Omnitrophota bacterium]|nr:hypothetical protein [Candidatus Omnitrophota bacterium]
MDDKRNFQVKIRATISVFTSLIFLSVLIGIFSIFVFQKSFLPLSGPGENGKGWADDVMTFYESASEKTLEEAYRSNVKRIEIRPQENSSRYHCASPCNEGLAGAVVKKLYNGRSEKIPEVLFWREPLFASSSCRGILYFCNWLTANLRFLSPQKGKGTPGPCSMGLFRMRPDGRAEPAKELTSQPTLYLTIEISDVKMHAGQNTFKAEFCLRADDGDPKKGAVILKESYKGATTQIFWFIRQKCPGWFMFVNIVLIFMLSGFLFWFRNLPYPAVKIGLLCCMLGQIYVMALLLLSPIPREQLQFFHDQTKIFYLVDINSEIRFAPERSDGQKAGPDYLARRLEERISERVVGQKPGELMAFWRWLWSRYSIGAIYRPRRFELNRPCVMDKYEFSGFEKDGWNYLGVVSRGMEDSGNFTASNNASILREARLVKPQTELKNALKREAQESANGSAMNLALVLTSASTSSYKDVLEFMEPAEAAARDGRDLRVFTILVPSIPTTGADKFYDFENGKAALISLESDYILPLNSRAYKADELESLLRKHGIERKSRAGGEPQVINLRSGLYDIPNISVEDKDYWDTPRDLGELRQKYLFVGREKIDAACDEIVNILKDMLSRGFDNAERLIFIHVIGRIPVFWLAVIALASYIFGFFAFIGQCNPVFFREFEHDPAVRIGHYAAVALSVASMVLFVFGVVWRAQNPEVWTDFGDPRWALAVGILCWLSWFVAPFAYFKVRGINGLKGEGLGPAPARYWALSVCMAGLAAIYASFRYIPEGGLTGSNLFWKFWLTFLLVSLTIFSGLIAPKGDKSVYGGMGHIEWWRNPWWSFLVKTLLIMGIIILFRGAFPATPSGWKGMTGLFSSFHRFVLTITIFWSIIGFAIALTAKPIRLTYWLGPAITVVASLALFLGG